ncbi:MAG TPA: c-type cytochrome [Candidatus Nanopelagicales bacterium]|nr:c-type cytochrome [Candidatus Nanopelagicales bacterium]
MRRRTRLLHLWAVALLSLAAQACDPAPSDVREWTAEDHDQPARPGAQVAARPGGEGADTSLVELAWQRNCFTCHGARGRGDGPQGPMVRAPDLTDPAWQDRVKDADIAETIRKGRNKMPPFDLPAQVIDGLVQRIRASRAR